MPPPRVCAWGALRAEPEGGAWHNPREGAFPSWSAGRWHVVRGPLISQFSHGDFGFHGFSLQRGSYLWQRPWTNKGSKSPAECIAPRNKGGLSPRSPTRNARGGRTFSCIKHESTSATSLAGPLITCFSHGSFCFHGFSQHDMIVANKVHSRYNTQFVKVLYNIGWHVLDLVCIKLSELPSVTKGFVDLDN